MNKIISQRLDKLRTDDTGPLTFTVLLNILNEGGFGLVLMVLAAPLALPLPALGIAQILALPLLFISTQLMIGKKQIYLPKKLAAKTIERKKIIKIIDTLQAWLDRTEKYIKPRFLFFSSPQGYRLTGLACIVCSLSIAVPVPFSNTVPAMAIVIMSIGLLKKDGVLQLIGITTGMVSICITGSFYFLATNTFNNFIFKYLL